MSIHDSLAALIKDFPQVRLVAYADLSSRMILASQSRSDVPQEFLDRLCQQAVNSFDDPLVSLSVEAFGEPYSAVVIDPNSIRVFLRSENEPADAFCSICDHSIDLRGFMAKTRAALDEISSAA